MVEEKNIVFMIFAIGILLSLINFIYADCTLDGYAKNASGADLNATATMFYANGTLILSGLTNNLGWGFGVDNPHLATKAGSAGHWNFAGGNPGETCLQLFGNNSYIIVNYSGISGTLTLNEGTVGAEWTTADSMKTGLDIIMTPPPVPTWMNPTNTSTRYGQTATASVDWNISGATISDGNFSYNSSVSGTVQTGGSFSGTGTKSFSGFPTLAVGSVIYWWSSAVSNQGNGNVTSIFSFAVSSGIPTLSASVTSGAISYGTGAGFSASESNTGDADCVYTAYRNGSSIGSGSSVTDASVLSPATYTYVYNTTGCTNWTNGSATTSLTVNAADPGLVISASAGWAVADGTSQNISCSKTATDTIAITLMAANGSVVATGNNAVSYLFITADGFNEGQWNCTSTATTNYTADYAQNTLSISAGSDTTAPVVLLVSPTDSSVFNATSATFVFNATDNVGVLNCSLYINNSLDQTSTSVTNGANSNFTKVFALSGNYSWKVRCFDAAGNNNFSTTTRYVIMNVPADADSDGLADGNDTLTGNSSTPTLLGSMTGFQIQVNGTADPLSPAPGLQRVVLYESAKPIVNFTYNFSFANPLDLRKVTIGKQLTATTLTIVANLSGQMSGTKIVYIDDLAFTSLCVKDSGVSGFGDITSACTGVGEVSFTGCLGNATGYTANGSSAVCYDEGSVIRIENLSFSGVIGTFPAAAATSGGGGGGGGRASVPAQKIIETIVLDEITPSRTLSNLKDNDLLIVKFIASRDAAKKAFSSHTVKILKVRGDIDSLEFEVNSNPIKSIVSRSQEKQLDVDGDGIFDLGVGLIRIQGKNASVQFRTLLKKPVVAAPVKEKELPKVKPTLREERPSFIPFLLWVPLIMVILLALIVLFVMFKKPIAGAFAPARRKAKHHKVRTGTEEEREILEAKKLIAKGGGI